MNTIFGNFLERTIPSLKGALISLNMGNTTSEMNLEDFKALMAPEPTPPTPIPEPSYKVYTALVSQIGSDEQKGEDTGLLTIGVTYYINNDSPGMDFTNVGAPNNIAAESTYFVATGTTPASWGSNEDTGNNTLLYNVAAPVVTVLENTIGDVWFVYSSVGEYRMYSNSLFTSNKTVSLNDQTRCIDNGRSTFYNLKITNPDPGQINITVLNDDLDGINDKLTSKPIEIRVYN
jgi:hypothetical protein